MTHPRAARASAVTAKIRRVEHGNDDDRTQVVDDRERQQEDLQRRWYPGPQQRQHADRERDVGRSGNCPPGQGLGIPVIESDVNQRWNDHPPQCRDCRQARPSRRRQRANHHLALDFETDEQEEHRHQAVVDPVNQVLVDAGLADPHRHGRLKQELIGMVQRRVGEDQRQDRRCEQDNPARRFVLKECKRTLLHVFHL